MFIYVIVNSATLKIYIGQHKGINLRKYLQDKFADAKYRRGGTSRLYTSMRKHPKEVWSIHPLISDLQTREECDHWEKVLIKALHTQHPDVGYNICRGGEGHTGPGYWLGKSRSPETNAKIGAANRNHIMPEQTRKALQNRNLHNQYNLGRVQSDDEKKQRSLSMQGKQNRLGQKQSPEEKAQKSVSLKQHYQEHPRGPVSEEQTAKLKAAHQTCSCPHHVRKRQKQDFLIHQ